MTQYENVVERQKLLLEAEEWSKGVHENIIGFKNSFLVETGLQDYPY